MDWFLCSASLLYLNTQNALNNMPHSPSHTHSYKHFVSNIHTLMDALESNLVSVLPEDFWHADWSSPAIE